MDDFLKTSLEGDWITPEGSAFQSLIAHGKKKSMSCSEVSTHLNSCTALSRMNYLCFLSNFVGDNFKQIMNSNKFSKMDDESPYIFLLFGERQLL